MSSWRRVFPHEVILLPVQHRSYSKKQRPPVALPATLTGMAGFGSDTNFTGLFGRTYNCMNRIFHASRFREIDILIPPKMVWVLTEERH